MIYAGVLRIIKSLFFCWGMRMMDRTQMRIAIDGPAAAGKSTVARMIAEKLHFTYIDTGAMYRALTLKALQEKVDVNNETELLKTLKHTQIELIQRNSNQLIFLDNKDVTLEIRSDQITKNVSIVAKHRLIREEMVKRQRELAKNGRVVMDGRDIGTHVIPDAELKIFLIASVEERAIRRHKENLQKGFKSDLSRLKKEIEERDFRDMNRAVAPLIKANDAIEIDTTSLTIKNVVDLIIKRTNDMLK